MVSKTDSDAALITHNNSKGVLLAHKVHIAVDSGPARIVTGVEVTPGNVAEAHVAPTLIGKHTWNTGYLPEEAVADKGYGRKHFYSFLKQAGILSSIPYPKPWKKKRKEKLEAGFVYDEKGDIYICPQGKKMYRMEAYGDGSVLYRVHRSACRGCPYKGVLCKAKWPSIVRKTKTELMDWVDQHLAAEKAQGSIKKRAPWVETIFAEMKTVHGLSRAALRERDKVQI